MDIIIKKPDKCDLDSFVNLYIELTEFNKQQFIKHHSWSDSINIRKERGKDLFKDAQEKSYILLLMAYENGKPVGFAHARIFDFKLRVGYFEEMFVNSDSRSQGVGKSFLNHVIQWMKDKKLVRMILSVYLWNDNALHFYKKSGFSQYAVNFEKSLIDENQ